MKKCIICETMDIDNVATTFIMMDGDRIPVCNCCKKEGKNFIDGGYNQYFSEEI